MNERAVLLVLIGPMIVSAEVAAQPAADGFRPGPFEVNGKSYTEEKLLYRYGPEYLQYVEFDREARGGRWYYDFFTSIGFDEGVKGIKAWDGENNWDNAAKPSFKEKLPAVVYAGVVARTANQIYLVYYVFHAGDYADGFRSLGWLGYLENLLPKSWTEHENDLEGGLVTIDRSSGKVVHVYALYHNLFDDRHLKRGLGEDKMAVIAPDGRVHVWVEAGGHGQRLFGSDRPAHDTPNNRRQFLRYRSSETEPSQGRTALIQERSQLEGGKAWKDVTPHFYRIAPLWPLFEAMYGDDGATLDPSAKPYAKPFDDEPIRLISLLDQKKPTPRRAIVHRRYLVTKKKMYKALRGARHGEDKAHFPWGQGDFDSYVRFLDPVHTLLKDSHENHPHEAISCGYEFNPYLSSLIGGTLDFVSERRLGRRCAEAEAQRPSTPLG